MADRGRVGGLVVASRSCAKKEWRAKHEAHRQRIIKVRPSTDMTEPITCSLESAKNNLKRERMLENRYMEIDRENQVLLKKMADVMKQPSAYMQAERPLPATLNQQGRKKELQEITKENRRMLKSIEEVAPVYDHTAWEKHWAKSEVKLKNCCQYPIITRVTRNKSAPGCLIQLKPDLSQSAMFSMPAAKTEIDGPVVFKDGKQLGDGYYLLEMATDGRTLSISAYDGETQKSYELIIKEKRHRQLHKECDGDYSTIASQLRVDGDRLRLV